MQAPYGTGPVPGRRGPVPAPKHARMVPSWLLNSGVVRAEGIEPSRPCGLRIGRHKASSADLGFLSQADGLHSGRAFLGNCLFLRTWPHDVDSGGIELCLQMRRIILLNHLHACPAVLGDLINVGTFKQAQANVGVAQAIRRSRPTVAVSAKLFFLKNCVE